MSIQRGDAEQRINLFCVAFFILILRMKGFGCLLRKVQEKYRTGDVPRRT